MPIQSIPRRSLNAQLNEPIPIDFRRGMFRVWIVISVAWMMGWIIYFIITTLDAGMKQSDLLVIPIVLIGPPIAILILGIATGWAFRGFRIDPPQAAKE
jgi:hypothetical protein